MEIKSANRSVIKCTASLMIANDPDKRPPTSCITTKKAQIILAARSLFRVRSDDEEEDGEDVAVNDDEDVDATVNEDDGDIIPIAGFDTSWNDDDDDDTSSSLFSFLSTTLLGNVISLNIVLCPSISQGVTLNLLPFGVGIFFCLVSRLPMLKGLMKIVLFFPCLLPDPGSQSSFSVIIN